jgi:hypothetical protein
MLEVCNWNKPTKFALQAPIYWLKITLMVYWIMILFGSFKPDNIKLVIVIGYFCLFTF